MGELNWFGTEIIAKLNDWCFIITIYIGEY